MDKVMDDSDRRLSDLDLDAVVGGKNQIVNFGGGISWVSQTKADGSLGTVWLCTPSQCTAH